MEKHFVKFIPNAGLGNQLYFFTYCNYLMRILKKDASLLIFESPEYQKGDTYDKEFRNPVLDIASSLGLKINRIDPRLEFYQLRWKKLPFYDSIFKRLINVYDDEPMWAEFNDLTKEKFYTFNIHTGYHQAYQYLTENFRESLKSKIKEVAPSSGFQIADNDVAVHIRRGDFNKFPEIFNLFGKEYYLEALNVLAQKVNIGNVYIFSDSFSEINDEIDQIRDKYNVILVEGQTVLQDFRLLMQFSNYTIGNSTFSWWAARLSDSYKPIVIVPQNPMKIMSNESRPYPIEWIKLKI